jgi:hypothetical protein
VRLNIEGNGKNTGGTGKTCLEEIFLFSINTDTVSCVLAIFC